MGGRPIVAMQRVILHGVGMAAGDEYRVKAANMNARARNERDPLARAEHEKLALAYLRLADQADKNAKVDLVYETPPARPSLQQQSQRDDNGDD
jgi:hypothetical protein